MADKKDVLTKVNGLKTCYPVKRGVFKRTMGYVKAIDDVNLNIYKGGMPGVVGGSGCSKITLGKSILQLIKPTEGSIRYSLETGEGGLIGINKGELNEARCKIQIVFQDPYSSLNPSFIVFGSIQEPLIRLGERGKKVRKEKTAKLLEAANLPPGYVKRYPNGSSDDRRQRIDIARVLSVSLEFTVYGETVSALNVFIQAQVLQLLRKLQVERGLIYMLITHDLPVMEYISDRIVVMYLRRVVGMTGTEELFEHAPHPYIKALFSTIPIADIDKRRKRIPLQGDVPSSVSLPPGCTFHPGCPECMEKYRTEIPHPTTVMQEGGEHMVRCHRVSEQATAKKEVQTTGGNHE